MSAPNDVSDDLRAIENAVGILSLRARGAAGMLPPEVAKFTDTQLAAAVVQAAVRVLAEMQEREASDA